MESTAYKLSCNPVILPITHSTDVGCSHIKELHVLG